MTKDQLHKHRYLLFYICCFGLSIAFGATCANVNDGESGNPISRYLLLACIINGLLFIIDRLAACFPHAPNAVIIGISLLRVLTITLTIVQIASATQKNGIFLACGSLSVSFQILTIVASILLFVMVDRLKKHTERRSRPSNVFTTTSSVLNGADHLSSLSSIQVHSAIHLGRTLGRLPLENFVHITLPGYSEVLEMTDFDLRNPPPGYFDVLTYQDGCQTISPPGYTDVSTSESENSSNPPPEYSEISSP